MHSHRRRAATALACVLGFVGLLGGQAAFGHAVLLSSDPAAEAELEVAPREIRLGFNENVGPIFVKVLDSSGAGNLKWIRSNLLNLP